MKNSILKKLAIFILASITLFWTTKKAFLQQEELSYPIAIQFFVADEEASAGDIIVKKEDKLQRADKPYDPDILGVVAENPIVSFGKETTGSKPIVVSGVSLVKVSAEKDPIRKGDFVTSSHKRGIGQKAHVSGFVLGQALEDLEKGEGMIKILVNPHEAFFEEKKEWREWTPWEAIGRIVTALERDVPSVLRYIFAMFLAAASFFVGFEAFVKNLREGIVVISINPLAKGSIRFAMFLNLIGIVIITLAGLSIALLVIIL